MRIAIVNWTNRRVGGPEGYLHDVLPYLQAAGHEVALWYETDGSPLRQPIKLPVGAPSWCVGMLGATTALSRLRDWQPDILYAHGLQDPDLEAVLLDLAPAVFFPHSYYGTCISGAKTFTWPTTRPCGRRFGPACLALYYPRRTGGLSPVSMVRAYRRQAKRLELMRRYAMLVTSSEHMRREYLRHGFAAERVVKVTYFIPESGTAPAATPAPHGGRPHLLFLGRMDRLKGGHVLLDALPAVAAVFGAAHATFAGDGPARREWQAHAAQSLARGPRITVSWDGWVDGSALERTMALTNLLVMPSLVPETFGRVGPEAGLRGVPAAAFNVGGISEWLEDGVNGHLASGDPPTASGLAQAIVRCLADTAHYQALCRGARQQAERFCVAKHLKELQAVFLSVAGQGT